MLINRKSLDKRNIKLAMERILNRITKIKKQDGQLMIKKFIETILLIKKILNFFNYLFINIIISN